MISLYSLILKLLTMKDKPIEHQDCFLPDLYGNVHSRTLIEFDRHFLIDKGYSTSQTQA